MSLQSQLSNILYQITRASDLRQIVCKLKEVRPASLTSLDKEVTLEGFFDESGKRVRVCIKLTRPESPAKPTLGVVAFQAAKKAEVAPTRADAIYGAQQRTLSQGLQISSGVFWDFLSRCQEFEHSPVFEVFQSVTQNGPSFVLFCSEIPDFVFAAQLVDILDEAFVLNAYVSV